MPKDDEKEISKYYCGLKGKSGQKPGSVRYCAKVHQIRRYGIKYVNEEDLANALAPKLNKQAVMDEEKKLLAIHQDIQKLVSDFKKNKYFLAQEDLKAKDRKRLELARERMLKRRDYLKKRFINQTAVVKDIKQRYALKKKARKAKKKKRAGGSKYYGRGSSPISLHKKALRYYFFRYP